jgi:DNA-binding NtrC family response regulator
MSAVNPSRDIVLVVDDDPAILQGTAQALKTELEIDCECVANGTAALKALENLSFGLVLLDLSLPDLSGEEILARVRQNHPELPVIIITALSDLESAVRCMRGGAYDYIVKGSDPGRLLNSVRRGLESRRKDLKIAALKRSLLTDQLKNPSHFEALVTGHPRMHALFRFIEAVAGSEEPILLQGETGTGKELFAQAIHRASGVAGPFVATNLGGLDDVMVSDTLFGHVKGAFTGADEPRKGMVVQASGGTLFLDEIGDLSPQSQVKLLRFLENREYFPLGTDTARRSEARIVAATNMDLEVRAEQGLFRRDLLYRLAMYRVDIPPLRERAEDIPLLCNHLTPGGPRLHPAAVEALSRYDFPGNIRELKGLLLKARALSNGEIGADLIETMLGSSPRPAAQKHPEPVFPTIHQAVSKLVDDALRKTQGHQASAAKLLGISPQALSKRLKQKENEL